MSPTIWNINSWCKFYFIFFFEKNDFLFPCSYCLIFFYLVVQKHLHVWLQEFPPILENLDRRICRLNLYICKLKKNGLIPHICGKRIWKRPNLRLINGQICGICLEKSPIFPDMQTFLAAYLLHMRPNLVENATVFAYMWKLFRVTTTQG